jgi:hypothetical protein
MVVPVRKNLVAGDQKNASSGALASLATATSHG